MTNLDQLMMAVEPLKDIGQEMLKSYMKTNFSDLKELGPLGNLLSNQIQQVNTTGDFYRVTFPKGIDGHLAHDANGKFLGAILDNSTNKVVGQARLEKVAPLAAQTGELLPVVSEASASLYLNVVAAIILLNINQKISSVEKNTKQILNYLETKDLSELMSDFCSLQDLQKNYKFNFKNEKLITSGLTQIQNVKHHSTTMLTFYAKQIEENIPNTSSFHINQNAVSVSNTLCELLHNEEIALYNYTYSAFLQVLFLGNFNKDFIDEVKKDIKEKENFYNKLYKKVNTALMKYGKASLDKQMLSGIADAHKIAGNAIKSIPFIGDTPLKNILKDNGNNLQLIGDKDFKKIKKQISSYKDPHIKPFINGLVDISKIYSQPLSLIIGNDQVYYKQTK